MGNFMSYVMLSWYSLGACKGDNQTHARLPRVETWEEGREGLTLHTIHTHKLKTNTTIYTSRLNALVIYDNRVISFARIIRYIRLIKLIRVVRRIIRAIRIIEMAMDIIRVRRV